MQITRKPTNKIKETILLTYDFFLIGIFTIGGGYAMIPQMRQIFCKSRKYLTEEEFWEILAISQITPGPIAVNMATFIGYRVSGFIGSLSATIGVVLPSFIVILLISIYLTSFTKIPQVKRFLIGILTGVVGEITYITFEILKKTEKNIMYLFILILSLVELFILRVDPILVILVGGLLGITLGKLFEDKNGSY
ncbi:MAG: chromate transporter [bacterium]|nr:chromate transporter [bacterium]